jgi:transposase
MSVISDLRAVAARLSLEESRPTCACCGKGRLVLIEERPDPNFGILGVTEQTWKCDQPECGKIFTV